MCYPSEHQAISLTQYFPCDQCKMLHNHTWAEAPLKMQNRPCGFQCNKVQKFTGMFSDLILQLTY